MTFSRAESEKRVNKLRLRVTLLYMLDLYLNALS